MSNHLSTSAIAGYAYDDPQLAGLSPVTEADLRLLESTVLWTDDDERHLRRAGEVLADQVDAVLDLWYGFVGDHPHLLHYFTGSDGQPDGRYLGAVRARFAQWVHDLCNRPRDRSWLDYQEEIARRHVTKKNVTDGVDGPAVIPLRYLVAFVYPITATICGFLTAQGDSDEDVDAMFQAWFKSVVLTVTLWARPYAEQHW